MISLLDGLDHAEDVASAPDGRLFLSNGGGAIGVLKPDAPLTQIGAPLAANGVAVDPIVAHMGLLKQQPGPLQRIDLTSGTVETLVSQLEGRQLVASSGSATARDGTIYCTHSSWGPFANDICGLHLHGTSRRQRVDRGAASTRANGMSMHR